MDLSIAITWLTALTVVLGGITWYLKHIANSVVGKSIERLRSNYVTKQELAYVEARLARDMESGHKMVMVEIKHLAQTLKEVKSEIHSLKPPTKF